MTWVFVDDHASEDERLCEVGGLAAWYHTSCAHGFCRRKEHLRKPEGKALDFIPDAHALGLYARYTPVQAKACVAALLRVGLWERVEGGYRLTDYAERYKHEAALVLPAATPATKPAGSQPTTSQLGGKARATGASRGPAGTFQPKQAGAQPKVQPAGPAKPAPRASDPVPDPETTTEKAAAKDLKASAREPASVQPEAAAALVSAIQERAGAVKADELLAHTERPHTWPELQSVARAWHMLAGRSTPRLGEYAVDADVRALVGLLAAGWPPDDLVALGADVGSWLAEATPDGRPRTLAMVTPAVLRIAQEQAARAEQVAAEARELVKATA